MFGFNTKHDVDHWLHQGQPFGRVANAIPMNNAIAQLHDVYRNLSPLGSNVGQMVPAFAITSGANFAGPFAPIIPRTKW